MPSACLMLTPGYGSSESPLPQSEHANRLASRHMPISTPHHIPQRLVRTPKTNMTYYHRTQIKNTSAITHIHKCESPLPLHTNHRKLHNHLLFGSIHDVSFDVTSPRIYAHQIFSFHRGSSRGRKADCGSCGICSTARLSK
jgi:hypothetical protein